MPLLLVMSGSGFHSDSGAFSELGNLPSVEVSDTTEPAFTEPAVLSGASAEESTEVGCRWQADRMFLSQVGQSKAGHPETSPVLPGCTQKNQHFVAGSASVHSFIRDKVVALTSDDYPITVMADSIAQYETPIAGLIVGIAKKESDWGKHTPKLHGEECFNYWGYRGVGSRGMTEDGYGCFEKPSDAVETIGNRLVELSEVRGTTEPANMVVWKCGSSCATHSPESVTKWISDVAVYYRQFVARS